MLLKKKGFILDIDGVVCRGNKPILENIQAIKRLKEEGKRIIFVSNNCGRSRRMFLEKLRNFGLEVSKDEILPATYATARFIANEKKNAKVFTTGEEGLKEELRDAGLELVDYTEAEYLVLAMNRHINYDLLKKALRLCLNESVRYIAVNPDKIFPAEDGPAPGTGVLIGALYWSTRRLPDVTIGKPSEVIIKQALEMLGLGAEDVAIVGDQIDVDILAGKKAGLATILVLTGVTNESNVDKLIARYRLKPDFVLRDLSERIS